MFDNVYYTRWDEISTPMQETLLLALMDYREGTRNLADNFSKETPDDNPNWGIMAQKIADRVAAERNICDFLKKIKLPVYYNEVTKEYIAYSEKKKDFIDEWVDGTLNKE